MEIKETQVQVYKLTAGPLDKGLMVVTQDLKPILPEESGKIIVTLEGLGEKELSYNAKDNRIYGLGKWYRIRNAKPGDHISVQVIQPFKKYSFSIISSLTAKRFQSLVQPLQPTTESKRFTIPEIIGQAIRESGGRASLRQIYGVVGRLRPGTGTSVTRGVLYQAVKAGTFKKNNDRTYSISRETTPEDVVRFGADLERKLYEKVKSEIQDRFQKKGFTCHIEVTADGQFTDYLKDQVKHDIVFTFIKRAKGSEHASPDLTGFTKIPTRDYIEDFITVEVKNERLTLDHLYQAKKYADLFSAKYGFLISTEPVPAELKKLHKAVNILSRFMSGYHIYLAQLDTKIFGMIIEDSWFPENLFK